jgi:hypothetical protein
VGEWEGQGENRTFWNRWSSRKVKETGLGPTFRLIACTYGIPLSVIWVVFQVLQEWALAVLNLEARIKGNISSKAKKSSLLLVYLIVYSNSHLLLPFIYFFLTFLSIQRLSGRDHFLAIRPPIVHLLLYVKCFFYFYCNMVCTIKNLSIYLSNTAR